MKCGKVSFKKNKVTTKDEVLKWNEYYCRKKFGIGVECTKCHKWRRVYEYLDLYEVPEFWECKMSKFDGKKGNCNIPSTFSENSFVEDKYIPGTVVWAKYRHYTWWPGMVEDDPDTQLFHKPDEDLYNVTFFGKNVSRGWVKGSNLRFFIEIPLFSKPKKSAMRQDLEIATAQAEGALKMSLKERFQHYSFVMLYKKKFPKAGRFVDVLPIDGVEEKMKLSNDFWSNDLKPKQRKVKTLSESSLGDGLSPTNLKKESRTNDGKIFLENHNFLKSKRKRTSSVSEPGQTTLLPSKKKRRGTESVSSLEESSSNIPKQRKQKLSKVVEAELSPESAKNELPRDTTYKELPPNKTGDIVPITEPLTSPTTGHPPPSNKNKQANHTTDELSDSDDDFSDTSSTFNFTCSTGATNGDTLGTSSGEDIFGDDEESEDCEEMKTKTNSSFDNKLPFLTLAIPDTSGNMLPADLDPVPSQFILGELVIDPNNPKYQTYKYYTKPPQE